MKKLLIVTLTVLFVFSVMATSVLAASQIPVNMRLTNAPVREVLTALGALGGVNIIVDDTVTGNVTFDWRNVPFENCLDLLTKTKGLSYQTFGNVVVVSTPERLAKGFGNVHVIKMQYAQASDVVDTLSIMFDGGGDKSSGAAAASGSTDKSGAGSKKTSDRFKVDAATNSVIFLGSDAETERIKDVLNEIDIPYQQVSLEAEVVAINKDNVKDFGIEWKWDDTPKYPEYSRTYNKDLGLWEEKWSRDKTDMIPTIRFGKSPAGVPYEFYYQPKINALVSKGNGKILARPKVTTINGKEAKILIGDSIPIPTVTVSQNQSQTTYEYKDVGIKLIYTPRINPDGQITAKVRTEVSNPTLIPALKAYQISTRQAETEVRMKDGETMVIGGLIGTDEMKASSKVPFLSDLPILGGLFKNSSNSKKDTEVVIFLTARVVK